jgi:hypothetical protein
MVRATRRRSLDVILGDRFAATCWKNRECGGEGLSMALERRYLPLGTPFRNGLRPTARRRDRGSKIAVMWSS